MIFSDTTATKRIFSLTKRIRAVAGGTSASKTISILIWLIDYAQSTDDELISVVSESFPHLSGGAIRDFENIMKGHGYWKDKSWIKSPKPTYTFETRSQIEFLSVDDYSKAHGPRRDILFLNECNSISYPIVDQLMSRTRKIIWIDWNPSEEFWFYTELLPHYEKDIDFITLTYLDNEALDDVTKNWIESHKHNKRWWGVYGLGQLGEIEGRIYTGWNIVDEIPYEAKLVRRGLDFGYSNDPSALIDIYQYNGGIILDELLYQKGLSNKQIADVITNQPEKNILTIADCSEPKSINEIESYGVTILPCEKGKDSVNNGIQLVQDQKISITKRSVNTIKEYKNYMWETDKDGETINTPSDIWNHSLDAGRYAITSLIRPKKSGMTIHRPNWKGFNRR